MAVSGEEEGGAEERPYTSQPEEAGMCAAAIEGEPSSSEVQPARSAHVVSPTSSPRSSCGETRTYLSGSLWKR